VLRHGNSLIHAVYIYTLVHIICLKTGLNRCPVYVKAVHPLDNYDRTQKKFDQLTRDIDTRIGATIDRLGDANGQVSWHTDLVVAARSAIAVRVNL